MKKLVIIVMLTILCTACGKNTESEVDSYPIDLVGKQKIKVIGEVYKYYDEISGVMVYGLDGNSSAGVATIYPENGNIKVSKQFVRILRTISIDAMTTVICEDIDNGNIITYIDSNKSGGVSILPPK